MADPVDEKSITILNQNTGTIKDGSQSITINYTQQIIDNKSIETELCTGTDQFSINYINILFLWFGYD